MSENKEKFLKSCCWGERMLASKFEDEPEFYFSFWKEGFDPNKLTWWMRIKLSWMLLFKGNYYDDQIVLSKKSAEELTVWIEKHLLEDKVKEMQKALDSNVRPREEGREGEFGDQ